MLQTTIRQASAAARRFTDPAWRPAGIGGFMAPGLRRLAEQAQPGSDRQLAYLQAFAGVATEPGDLAMLAGLLDGSAHLDGLEVDTELRWRLLQRLVSQGAAGAAEIDAELDRDPTDAGERRAATCRAAIPDAAAKEAAWQAIVSGTLPGATFRATRQRVPGPGPRRSCYRPMRRSSSTRSARCGRTGAATWRSTSPATPTR